MEVSWFVEGGIVVLPATAVWSRPARHPIITAMNGSRRTWLLAAASAWLACAGCSEAPAQEVAKSYRHAVYEHDRLRDSSGERERFRWSSAEEELEAESIGPLWQALKVAGDPAYNARDDMRVLDHLARAGWELAAVDDTSFVLAGLTVYAQRYVVRQRR
jgi:hypothetical protein